LDDRGIPTGERRAVAGTPYDFGTSRRVGDVHLDTAYTDLERDGNGRARVRLEGPAGRPAVILWLDEHHPYVMAFTGDSLPDRARRRVRSVWNR
jgi:aldose 1-epimerase